MISVLGMEIGKVWKYTKKHMKEIQKKELEEES
jgi:hypothetical protein